VLDSCTAPSAAGIPLARGALFAAPAGLILVFTPEGTAPFFGSLGLPPTQADRVTVGEVVGRIALFPGVLTGSVARSLVPILLGAIVLVHLLMAFFLSNPHAGWNSRRSARSRSWVRRCGERARSFGRCDLRAWTRGARRSRWAQPAPSASARKELTWPPLAGD
jgi:putative oxidoreductase